MKKIIAKTEYDTERAELIRKHVFGSPGDASGYEETLFKTPEGKYFLYVNGGEDSPYPEENIKRMSEAAAKKWLSELSEKEK